MPNSLKLSFMPVLWILLVGWSLQDQNNSSVDIYVIGDTRNGHDTHQAIVDLIAQDDYDAIINTGDLVGRGSSTAHWNRFIEISQPLINTPELSSKYLAVFGNHDRDKRSAIYANWNHFLDWLPGNGQYYYQDIEDVRIIVLNSVSRDDTVQDDSLRSWLSHNTRKWLIVAWHYPTFPFGSKHVDQESLNKWWPLMHEYGVDLVLNGHAHYYARTYPLRPLIAEKSCARDDEGGTIQVISGGAGAPTYKIRQNRHNRSYFEATLAKAYNQDHHYCKIHITDSSLNLKAWSLSGELVDDFTIHKK